jgi:TRAP-type C4-dicarboxylate transport system permease small subunit
MPAMNKKRKILTLIVLAAIGAIIFFTYYSFNPESGYQLTDIPAIRNGDAPLFFFALAALYPILFFFFGEGKYTHIDKRKILTVVALVVFGAIIWLNYDRVTSLYPNVRASAKAGLNMQLLALLVAYIGLFFILGPSAPKNRPPNP